ncbi:ABC transporter ATP-binding protein [Clostridium subterminale]|uniref:ABC transporter ATP-binding protein n=2 Tax=Clostridium TaxID=1485 RepID=A0ABN1KWS9_CLOSU
MKLPLKDYFQLLYKYLKRQKFMVILLFFILVMNLVIQLVNPQILRYYIDAVTQNEGIENLLIAALLFMGFGIIRQVFKIVSTYISEKVGWTATNALRSDLIKHCINLDMDFHKAHQSGEMLERVDGDINALFSFFSTFVLQLLSNLGLLIGIILLLYREDWRIGLTLTMIAILDMVAMKYIEKKSLKHWEKSRAYNAQLYGFLGEQITSVEDINTCGAKNYTMNSLYKLYRKMLPIEVKASLGHYYMWIANIIVFALGNVVALILSAYFYGNSLITFGTVYLIFYYVELMSSPLEEIRSQMQKLQRAEASIKRVKELLQIKSRIEYGIKNLDNEDSIDLSLEKVSFSYEDGEAVLKDININIEKNTVLGVLGHTGSGKTTLARLIVRLYDVCSGSIKFNGENLKSMTKESLMENISYVTQEVQIFHATVRENLTLFNPNIKDDTILKVIEDIGLTSWLNNLPEGLNTILDNGGSGLSSGEAQLLAFVRVFLKNPKLVILDEATSKLDPITEGLIDRALNKLLEERTCIIIAHRLGTVGRADNILILEEGTVLEYGNRKELCKDRSSKFYNLLQKGMEEVLA